MKTIFFTLYILLSFAIYADITTTASSVLENKERYSHKNVIDGDIFTAWSEGAPKEGINEWVQLDFGEEKDLFYLGIIPGYTKYNDKVGEVWFKNHRVKEAKLVFSDQSSIDIELIDKQKIQYFKINKKTSYVKLIIKDTFKGSTWQDTCTSEIKPIFDSIDDLRGDIHFDQESILTSTNTVYALLELQAPFQQPSIRDPLNLCLVIDQSGSMQEGNKMNYVKEAAKLILGSLDEQDTLSIIGYDDTPYTYYPSTKLTKGQKNNIVAAIDTMYAMGGTNISDALLAGIYSINTSKDSQQVKNIFLLSDGIATSGDTRSFVIENHAFAAKKKHNISISAFGVGENYNEDLLSSLADVSMGSYYYIQNPRQIFMNLHSEISNLKTIAFKNMMLDVDIPEGFELETVFGYNANVSKKSVNIQLPPLQLGEKKYVLLKLKKAAKTKPSLFDAVLSKQSQDLSFTLNGKLKAFNKLSNKTFSTNISKTLPQSTGSSSDTTPYYDQILKILSAQKLSNAIGAYKKGNQSDALLKLKTHIETLKKDNEFLKSPVLDREIRILSDILSNLKTTSPNSADGNILIKASKLRAINILKGDET